MSARVKKVGKYHWRQGETDYRLTDIPSGPCHECGAEIEDGKYCYFREGPHGSLDHICWDCGNEVTGFGN